MVNNVRQEGERATAAAAILVHPEEAENENRRTEEMFLGMCVISLHDFPIVSKVMDRKQVK